MQKAKTIGITLHANQQFLDLKIPLQITVARLKQILAELQLDLPEDFEIQVVNKPIHLSEDVLLADYPLGDGDQLAVQPTK